MRLAMFLTLVCLVGNLGCDQADKAFTSTRSTQRTQARQLYNSYQKLMHEIGSDMESILKEEVIDIEGNKKRLPITKTLKSRIDRFNPYDPLGVDPRLAEAIADFKLIFSSLVDFIIEYDETKIDLLTRLEQAKNANKGEAEILKSELNSLEERTIQWGKESFPQLNIKRDKVERAFNQVAAELGGLER